MIYRLNAIFIEFFFVEIEKCIPPFVLEMSTTASKESWKSKSKVEGMKPPDPKIPKGYTKVINSVALGK